MVEREREKDENNSHQPDGFPPGVLSEATDIHYYCSSIQGDENVQGGFQ